MSKTVYISGPMTGMPDLNRCAFTFAEGRILAHGMKPVNPHTLCDPSWDWNKCMRADVTALCACDALLLLPGWENSKGAKAEKAAADALGLEIIIL